MKKPEENSLTVFFVQDPLTKKHYNLLPLFKLMDEQCEHSNGALDVSRRIQAVLDFMCTTVHADVKDPEDVVYLNHVLVDIRKAFDNMVEFA